MKKKVIIPNDTDVFYCPKKNIITFSSFYGTKSLKPFLKILIDSKTNSVIVTTAPTQKLSKNKIKKMRESLSLQTSLLNNKILEAKFSFYVKLKLVGVGYRVLLKEKSIANNSFFTLKLGYSHLLNYKLPLGIEIFCYKYIKLTLYGHVPFNNLTQTAAKIRDQRPPEPYKGKGVLYQNERVRLKAGKKV